MGCCFSDPIEEPRHAVYIHPNNQLYPLNPSQGQLYVGPPIVNPPIPFYPAPPPSAPLGPYNQAPPNLPYQQYPSAIPNNII